MCFEDGSSVAARPQFAITSADSSTFGAFLATPHHPNGRRIVLVPDVLGLRPAYHGLGERFAETGAEVLVIDYYGRTAGPEPRGDLGFDRQTHGAALDRASMLADIAAGVAYVNRDAAAPTYVAGFCLGGAMAMLAGTTDLDLAGVIAFCPYLGAIGRSPALPVDFVRDVRCDVLGLFGGADTAVPPEQAHAHAEHLTAAGATHEFAIYPDMPHGFFELHTFGEADYHEAADDAFARLNAFVNA